MRRRPFSENVHCRVDVTLVCHATVVARPHAVSQGEVLIDTPADRAQFCGGEPRIDVRHQCPHLGRDVMQHAEETGTAQVRDFPPPQGLHPLQVQGLQGDAVLLSAELVRQLPVERLPLAGNTPLHTVKMPSGLPAVAGALALRGQSAVRLGKCLQAALQRLRCLIRRAITSRQRGRQPKVAACALTCHDADNGLWLNKPGAIPGHVAQRVTRDRHRLDGAFALTRLGKLVDRCTDLQPVTCKQLPPGLRQREGLSIADLATAGWTNTTREFPSFARLSVGKERLGPFVDACRNVLDGL